MTETGILQRIRQAGIARRNKAQQEQFCGPAWGRIALARLGQNFGEERLWHGFGVDESYLDM